MTEIQTPENYKEFFKNSFVENFDKFLNETIKNIQNEDLLKNLNKLKLYAEGKGDKNINYSKIISKMFSSKKLMSVLKTLDKHNFEDKSLFMASEKYKDETFWCVIPSLNILKIFIDLKTYDSKKSIYKKILKLYNCSCAYTEIENNCEQNSDFSIENFNENYGINDITKYNKIEDKDTVDLILDMFSNKFSNKDVDLDKQISEMTENEINSSTENLNNLLKNKIDEGNQSAKLISSALDKLKYKIGDLKNNKKNTGEKTKLKNIINIAKEITTELSGTVDKDSINPEELWDTTTNLASQTVNNPNIELISNFVKHQIMKAKENETISKNDLTNDITNIMEKMNVNK